MGGWTGDRYCAAQGSLPGVGAYVPEGLSRGQIANLTDAAPATVGYHLGLARTQDPGLQNEHETAARKPSVTGQGRERLQQLVAFVQDTGRYPSRSSDAVAERTLAAWLQRRRREAADGTLAPAYRQALAPLPGWRGTHPGRPPMRHYGRNCSLRWWRTWLRGRTGRATRQRS
jgi:hypothetical protein